jgi:hypothetical protein
MNRDGDLRFWRGITVIRSDAKRRTLFLALATLLAALLLLTVGRGLNDPANAQTDDTPPELVEFGFTPKTVDVSTDPATLIVTARITDDLSGAATWTATTSPSQATFRSPSGVHKAFAHFDSAQLLSGTPQDGLYAVVVTIPAYAEPGIWTVNVSLKDAAGNVWGVDAPDTLEVISATPDTTAPEVVDFDFTPDSVDVSTSGQTVKFTARFTDEWSGLAFGVGTQTQAWFISPSAHEQISVIFDGVDNLVDGTAKSGLFESSVTVPAHAEPGEWVMDRLLLVDEAGNTEMVGGAAIAALGFPTTFTVISSPSGPPDVHGISPTSGPTAGGTPITITGHDFTGTTYVDFDGTHVIPTSVTDTQILVTSPAHAAGIVHLRVHTATEVSAPTSADNFRYLNAPVVTSASPDNGPAGGGTVVTIHGANLSGAFEVLFGDTSVAPSQVTDDTVVVTSPLHSAGTVDIRVRAGGGLSAATAAARFTYVATGIPVVTGVTPASGSTAGGTVITIDGAGFLGTSSVRFGDELVSPSSVTNTRIVVVSPPHGAGVVHLRVTTTAGTSPDTAADDFTFVPGTPLVLAVFPRGGPVEGGTVVTITGTGFTGATSVQFDGASVVPSTVTDTSITVTAPPHAPDVVNVLVVTPRGTSVPSVRDHYTYGGGGPHITAISTATGPTSGGTTVTITGTGFAGASAVLFGDAVVTPLSVTNTQVVAVSPPHAAGLIHIRVVTPGGVSPEVPADDFIYGGVPAITRISPVAGSVDGGTVVTIFGSGFVGATSVTFGGKTVTPFYVSESEIQVVAPAATVPGAVHLRVTTLAGTSPITANGDFTYVSHTAVFGLSPRTGSSSGGTLVTITGIGFTGATIVNFGGVGATPTSVSDTEIRVVAPAHPAGTVHLRISSTGGSSAPTSNDDFTYVDGGGTGVCVPQLLWVNDGAYGSAGGGFYWDPANGGVWTAERGWHRFSPVPARPSPSPLWVNDVTYGSRGGGFYWDPKSGQVWTAERGWHDFARQYQPLWVNDATYGSPAGGFYWDPMTGQVWTPQRGWHTFAPIPARPSAPLWVNQANYGSAAEGFWWDPATGQVWTVERGWHSYSPGACP